MNMTTINMRRMLEKAAIIDCCVGNVKCNNHEIIIINNFKFISLDRLWGKSKRTWRYSIKNGIFLLEKWKNFIIKILHSKATLLHSTSLSKLQILEGDWKIDLWTICYNAFQWLSNVKMLSIFTKYFCKTSVKKSLKNKKIKILKNFKTFIL